MTAAELAMLPMYQQALFAVVEAGGWDAVLALKVLAQWEFERQISA